MGAAQSSPNGPQGAANQSRSDAPTDSNPCPFELPAATDSYGYRSRSGYAPSPYSRYFK